MHGALTQARHLYLELTRTDLHPAPRVLELGFGLGINFWVTLQHCLERGVRLEYLAFEIEPVAGYLIRQAIENLPLVGSPGPTLDELTEKWGPGGLVLTGRWGQLTVLTQDIRAARLPERWATAIYLDPFSPAVNPQAWSPQIMQQLHCAAAPGALLATYSVAGQVRRGLSAAGFRVQKVPGRGKKAWLQAHSD